MIQIRNLSFSYAKRPVIQDVCLQIEKKSTLAVIGPSGCGKTTFLYLMAGLLDYNQGEILIDGLKVNTIRNNTGIILQNFGLFPWKTVYQNVALGMANTHDEKKKKHARVMNALEELGISDIYDRYPAKISGGQKQRTAIARTLIRNPDLLLMDEASSALDAMTKESIQNLLLRILRKKKPTMIFVTHSIEEAVFLGQSIAVMKNGTIETVINNERMGMEEYRMSPAFFDMCKTVREALVRP